MLYLWFLVVYNIDLGAGKIFKLKSNQLNACDFVEKLFDDTT